MRGQTSATDLPALPSVGRQLSATGFLHELLRAQQGRQMPGDTIQRRAPGVFGAIFFSAFDFLPIRPNLIHVLYLHIAENVRMAPDKFLNDVARHLIEIECFALPSELAMK